MLKGNQQPLILHSLITINPQTKKQHDRQYLHNLWSNLIRKDIIGLLGKRTIGCGCCID
jgi:hypothetical protein